MHHLQPTWYTEVAGCPNGSVRLAGGYSSSEGRVEVCIDGTWTSVSAPAWDYSDSRVVCRQLGYYDQCENIHSVFVLSIFNIFSTSDELFVHMIILIGAITITESYFTPGHSKIYYTDVFCTGNEKKLSSCPNKHTCTQDPLDSWYNDERAGVACQSKDSKGNLCNILTCC